MSIDEEIFKKLNSSCNFIPDNDNATYKEIIPDEIWIYFGKLDDYGGPYIGYWIETNIKNKIRNMLKNTLKKSKFESRQGKIIYDGDVLIYRDISFINNASDNLFINNIITIINNLEYETREKSKGKEIEKHHKSKVLAYTIWLFLGLIGGHKFYIDKIKTGILYLLTAGLVGIGWIFDLFTLILQIDLYNGDITREEYSDRIFHGLKKVLLFPFFLIKNIFGIILKIIVGILSILLSVNYSPSSKKRRSSGGVYYCRDCGNSGTITGLKSGTCRISPTGHHRPYSKPGKAGGSSGVCYCKDCGASGTFTGLRSGHCSKSPTGYHRPYRKYYG
jgi:hypothetical protein